MRITTIVLPGVALVSLVGCAGAGLRAYAEPRAAAEVHQTQASLENRLLIKTAALHLEVDDIREAAAQAAHITAHVGGYVDRSDERSGEGATLELRVPSAQLEVTLDKLAGLGDETSRQVSTEDVTDTVIDLEAILKNKIALRDRLRTLLQKAGNVQDVLTVEEQFTRVQSEIDSLEGQLKSLKSRARLASISLELTRPRILGPLGYVGYGIGWVIAKLFVIQ
jgi:hypothetical protein